MKINSLNELSQNRLKGINSSEEAFNEVKLLMDGESNKEKEALKKAGLDFHINQVDNKKGSELERKKLEDEYKSLVFTEEEIKKMCIKYDLRFLNTKHFIGKVDIQVGGKVAKFIEENTTGGHDPSSFYMMAPPNAFSLNKREKQPKKIDPILFYKTRDEKYVYIHKWGTDFTILRRLRGIFFKSESSMRVLTFIAWMLLLLKPYIMLATVVNSWDNNPGWSWTLSSIAYLCISLLGSYCTLCAIFNEYVFKKSSSCFYDRETKRVWNKNEARRAH